MQKSYRDRALHLYLLTRFSNRLGIRRLCGMLYTFIYLQGSQTRTLSTTRTCRLYTFIYLQGSQTGYKVEAPGLLLYTFIYLQGSQTAL